MTKAFFRRCFYKFITFAGAVSVRTKIMGIVLGLVLLLGFTLTWQVRQLLVKALYEQQHQEAVALTRDLSARATDLILINDLYALQVLLQDTQRNYPNVLYAFIIDKDGYVIAHTFDQGMPPNLIDANIVQNNDYEHTVILQTSEGYVWDTAVPIFGGNAGIARLGLSDYQVKQTVNSITGQLLLTTVLVSVLGISAAIFLMWVLTRPIIELVDAAHAVSQQNFSHRVRVWAEDEIGRLSQAFNMMIEALERAEKERAEREILRAQYVQGVIAAQEDERKRVARELHDSTSQSLTSLMIGLKMLEETCQRCRKLERVSELRNIAGQTLEDVHSLAIQLRPSVLDDLGLPDALRRYVAEFQRRYPSLNIDLAITGFENRRLPSEVETALYRIIQEALTNIIRHAEAQTASILVECRANSVLAIVDDDGKGFDVSSKFYQDGHLGLYGIQERVELLSGQVEIESELGHGTSIYVNIPLAATTKEVFYG